MLEIFQVYRSKNNEIVKCNHCRSFFTKSILNGTFQWLNLIEVTNNSIGGAMVSMFTSSAVGHGFKPRSGQTKNYKVGICCFSAKYAALMRKSKDWLVQNQDNVSVWNDNVYQWTVVSVN